MGRIEVEELKKKVRALYMERMKQNAWTILKALGSLYLFGVLSLLALTPFLWALKKLWHLL